MNLQTISFLRFPSLYSFGQVCCPLRVWTYALKNLVWSVPTCDFEQLFSDFSLKQSSSFSIGCVCQSIAAKELSSEPLKCSPRSQPIIVKKLFCLGLSQALLDLGLQWCLEFHLCLWFCRLSLLEIVKDPRCLPYRGLIHCLEATQNLACSLSHQHHLMMH